ncbi:unnamed protein product [Rotaria sordida]|uniref:G-protein coupled receptors family 1 profile domain-containing protein n=1 Tax=Rotaria sordida TaxID=392033 RepID=A0A815K2G8_9BILA|nr:unnamed protein product [Rotaria sordida]
MSSLSNTLNLAQKMLVQYCHTTIFILGTIGSLINICLFSRRNLRSNSCCIYLLSSSINGLILLSIGIIPQIYNLYRSPNPFTTILSFCKARSYLNQTSAMSCRWLLVMACIDRCFSCSTSVRIRNLSSVNTARIIVIIINIIWFILPIHMIIYANIQPPGNIACSITNNNVDIYHRFYTIIMGGALPSLIAFISSLFIWKNFQKRTKRRILLSNNELSKRKQKRDQQVIFMLLIQVTIFIISTIPFMSFNIYSTMTQYITDKSTDRKAIEGFLKTLTELLIYFIAMSFYSNTLVSKTFRKELIKLFKCIFICSREQNRLRITPLNTATTNNTTTLTGTTNRTAFVSMRQIIETPIKI